MLRREISVQETEFNVKMLQEWVCRNYSRHFYTFRSLVDKLREAGFCIKTCKEKEEILNTVNTMIEKKMITVIKIHADHAGAEIEISDCEFIVE